MVQNSSLLSSQQLAKTLGQVLLEQELDRCYQQSEIQQPTAAKQFWQSTTSQPGIYIVVAGKVRLLDRADELIVTLEKGASFGESTLFPPNSFQPYSARASVNVQLCFLPSSLLQNLSYSYLTVRSHLEHQAVLRDWLLLSPQIAALRKIPGLMQALSLLDRHDLPVGQLPTNLENQKLWLLRQGQLLHPCGQQLTAGSIYAPSQLSDRSWQVAQPTELYSFTPDKWKTALDYLPQLSQLISSEALPVEAQKRFNPNKAIAGDFSTQATKFPESKNQKKISKAYFPNPTVKVGQLWQRFTRRYPYFQQQSASDCGAACLVMVSRYWGKHFSVNRLREIANVDRNGASLRGLAVAAESIGFTTRPVKASLDKLAQAGLPAIAHWEGKHYIVVYEVRRDRVIVADPAIGQRSLTRAQFLAGWTGYTLLLQPTALFKEADEAKQSFWQFFELVKPHRLVLLEIFAASILIQLFGLITPLFTHTNLNSI